jgi:hypothetical protein
MAMGMIAFRFGVSAAADESTVAKAVAGTPISIAGRWTGNSYGYGRRAGAQDCGDTGCGMTYDIVACKEGWCGISVKNDKSCGAVGLHLAADRKVGEGVFKGELEPAKGAAPYAVEAWYGADKDSGAIGLHFVGNTGAELLLFRRSYPFEADMTRAGDATCTLDKATS